MQFAKLFFAYFKLNEISINVYMFVDSADHVSPLLESVHVYAVVFATVSQNVELPILVHPRTVFVVITVNETFHIIASKQFLLYLEMFLESIPTLGFHTSESLAELVTIIQWLLGCFLSHPLAC